MSVSFFERPILNSPYEYPSQHWDIVDGLPTDRIIGMRRRSEYTSPVPQPKKRRKSKEQPTLELGRDGGFATDQQRYDPTPIINEIRGFVDAWRRLPNPNDWHVTPETARLLQHWRQTEVEGIRPFFCQIEAVETAIWLTEVAPSLGKRTEKFSDYLKAANEAANPGLMRLALKLATGAGKTTVMAMLIAWQTINAVRRPNSSRYSRAFLLIAPGITIKDRLRVLLPTDPESYFETRNIVPADMKSELRKARIIVTNYHAFKLKERIDLAKGTRAALEGWREEKMQTLETEGQMVQRVAKDLMGLKNIIVINDEAHHCYREKPKDQSEEDLTAEEKEEAKRNSEAARMWISGIEAVQRTLGVRQIFDLSATPFFLSGSGYAEGTLFPWVVSDFSLMDAIECGIVKLPRVPVADNVPGGEMPKFRDLWDQIRQTMPKQGRAKGGKIYDPLLLPTMLVTALEALYGHYAKVFAAWQTAGINVPPVFIVVCNNTATSKLVYDYISGFYRDRGDGSLMLENGRLPLFRNFDGEGNRLPRPQTLLIDSAQLESGEALDKDFLQIAEPEIEAFKRERIERSGDRAGGEKLTDQDLLREVMNTVGKEGKLGEQVRCVVSVSMLTEGWDTNTVTHVLGVRAFGTQLLCEQVVGRALRRRVYELNAEGLFDVEYADVLGIPFDFTAEPVIVQPATPRDTVRVRAVNPEREALEIRFPRVEGYRTDLPEEQFSVAFSEDSALGIDPTLVGPSITRNQGIIGEAVDLTVDINRDTRPRTIAYKLTHRLIDRHYRDADQMPKLHLFGQLKRIVEEWVEGGYIRCAGGCYPAQVLYPEIAEMACQRIRAAINAAPANTGAIKAILDPYNPMGSTRFVNFTTSKDTRWQTDPRKCHINWAIYDSDWEAEFCRVAEAHPRVRAYVKNQTLGFEVPYSFGSLQRRYIPDFIVQIDDGKPDLLNLVVEIKGYRGEDAKDKALTMQNYWVPGVNNLGTCGRWEFVEFTEVHQIDSAFAAFIERKIAEGRGQK